MTPRQRAAHERLQAALTVHTHLHSERDDKYRPHNLRQSKVSPEFHRSGLALTVRALGKR